MNARLRAIIIASSLLASIAVLTTPRAASAHGIWGHIHVTGWAIENLPPGELRDFFDDPEVMNAALFGAAFTDSGYWVQAGSTRDAARAYSEHTHWEPFIEDFVQWVVENDPPPWDSQESRMRVAFLMGCASHGLQDEIFDSLFLDQVQVHDNGGQDVADPGTDGFLATQGHLRFSPTRWVPMETVLELYAEVDDRITEQVIDAAVTTMTVIYVNDGGGQQVAAEQAETYGASIPWTEAHYLDPDIPGSLRAEINPTGAYLQAIWDRLHGRFGPDDLVIHVYPETPRRLRSHESGVPDSTVTFIFGRGVDVSSIQAVWTDAAGTAVPFDIGNTRWGATWSRLARLQPTADLVPGVEYDVELLGGIEQIDGSTSADAHPHRFQVLCDPPDQAVCPDLGEIPAPSIDGRPPELEPGDDTGTADAGTDAGTDAGEDVTADASTDAAPDDAPAPSPADESGCSAAPGTAPGGLALAIALAITLRRRRRSA